MKWEIEREGNLQKTNKKNTFQLDIRWYTFMRFSATPWGFIKEELILDLGNIIRNIHNYKIISFRFVFNFRLYHESILFLI